MSDNKIVNIKIFSGPIRPSLYINDYRVAGPKPAPGSPMLAEWTITKEEILKAFMTPDERHEALTSCR